MKRLLSTFLLIVLAFVLMPATALGGGRPTEWPCIFNANDEGKKVYWGQKHNKAIAYDGERGACRVSGRSSVAIAKRVALSCCNEHYGKCEMYDVNGSVCGTKFKKKPVKKKPVKKKPVKKKPVIKKTVGGPFKVTTPNGGQKWQKGKSYFLKWRKGKAGTYVDVYLYKAGKYNRTIKSKAKNSGRLRWRIPTSLQTGSQYKIRVQAYSDSDIYDDSNSNFTISNTASTTANSLKVTSPNGGEKWQKGPARTIKWQKGNGGTYVDIYLYRSGKYERTIKTKVKNSGRHRWVIPMSVKYGTQYRIRIQSYTDSDIYDESDRNFTVN